MIRSNGSTPAAIYMAALQAGKTPLEARAIAYPTPALFADNKGKAA